MLLIKLLKLNSINSLLFYLIFLFFSSALSNEPVDIWKKKNNQTKQNLQSDTNNSEKNSSINYQKKNNLEEIKITDINVEDETVDLIGLYDPEENDLKLTMQSNTDGIIIKNSTDPSPLPRNTVDQVYDFILSDDYGDGIGILKPYAQSCSSRQ